MIAMIVNLLISLTLLLVGYNINITQLSTVFSLFDVKF